MHMHGIVLDKFSILFYSILFYEGPSWDKGDNANSALTYIT